MSFLEILENLEILDSLQRVENKGEVDLPLPRDS